MNYGKLTESVYECSIAKVVKTNSDKNRKFYDGAGLGADCAVFPYSDEACGQLVSGQASACGRDAEVALRAFTAAVNHTVAAANGSAYHMYANLMLTVPEKLREIKVRQMMEQAARKAEELGIPILSANVQVLPNVSEPVAGCVVSGNAGLGMGKLRKAGTDEDIVMTKWLGLEGTAVIAGRKFDELCGRYPADIVEEARNFGRLLSIIPEAATAGESGVSAMQVLRDGGVFGGLWSLAASNGVGLVVDLKSIPVRQETIEVCEFFDLNPYELLAGGSLLMTAKNGGELVRTLNEQGIAAAVIGKTCVGNDRIIRHEEESRFLEPARSDEIYKILIEN